MIKTFYAVNIISALLYPLVFIKIPEITTNTVPYMNVLFLLFVALLFLSIRVMATIFIRIKNEKLRNVFGIFVAIFPLIFPLSGLVVSFITQDKRQVIPYALFEGYYFFRFFPVLKQMEVSYHV